MNLMEWSRSSVDYGQKLVNSALEGAREGEEEFLKDESLSPRLTESARHALMPALIGAYLGAFGGSLAEGGAGQPQEQSLSACWAERSDLALAWLGRTGRWARASLPAHGRRIKQTRDEHWFEKNPIDYA